MQKIIVTGGAGFIGSHTVVELLNKEYEVVILDNFSNSQPEILEQIEEITGKQAIFHKVDLTNREQLIDVIKLHHDAHAVIHFAAFKAVGESVEDPLMYYHNNLVGLINLLVAMDTAGINRLVYSSSCTVYGSPMVLPVDENHPFGPATSPYGNTKKIGEDIVKDQTDAGNNFSAIALRYFNPIGAHESGLIGELPTGIPSNLMPFITQTAAGIRKELLVFGNDYNTIDGTAVRDYIHIVDLAQAHVATVQFLLDNKADDFYDAFNLGTGRGSSVLEVIQSFERSTGITIPFSYAPRRGGDVESTYAATDKANTILKWKAQRSLDDMTSSAWKWEKKYRGL